MTTAPVIAAPSKGKAWHSQSAWEILAQLGSRSTGLSAQEAAQRLAANGPYELKETKRINPLQIFLGQLKSLIIWTLITAAVISGVLGEVVDAIAIVVLNTAIGFYQEFKAEKSIAALKKMSGNKPGGGAMKEVTLRKWHRRLGITLALFIVLQTGSGLVMSALQKRLQPHDHAVPVVHDHDNHSNKVNWENSLKDIHHGGGVAGNIYRVLLGVGTLGMSFSGTIIFFMVNNRMKRLNIKK